MDNEERKELSLQEAENLLKHEDYQIGCNNMAVVGALVKVIDAMRNENYQLIKLNLLIEKIDEIAKKSLTLGDDGAVYIACLEDVTAIIKDCL